MMAITTISALPWMLEGGTIGPVGRTRIGGRRAGWASGGGVTAFGLRRVGVGLFINIEPSLGEDHAPGIDLVHQAEVVGGDHHGGA